MPSAKYLRVRVRSPSVFRKGTLRTQDIGRAGHSKRIAGQLKRTGKWATQNFMIRKSDLKRLDTKAKTLLSKIKAQYPRAKIHR
ncbi:hypothetical protein MUP79_06480 [Candidatus Bathyarchaeota archaeon]|nr:hypothetical protein [Candidatus Bathyarchaeota archaeon]